MSESTNNGSGPRVLIIGGAGMLGHKLYQILSGGCDVWATVRGDASRLAPFNIFDQDRLLGGVDVQDLDTVTRAIAAVRPQVLINAVGVIKQLPTAKDPIVSLNINSLLPHRLAALAGTAGARFITFSTDCIFNGRKGNYRETDPSDAEDLYGRSKFLGEVASENCLTIRSSIIGRELGTAHSLIEWFLSNRGGKVKGFRRAIYSGLPTIVMAQLVRDLIVGHPELSGIYQVSSDPIDKYELLRLVRDAYDIAVEIEADDDFVLDRSLDSSRFRAATGYVPPTWPMLVAEMAADPTPYDELRA